MNRILKASAAVILAFMLAVLYLLFYTAAKEEFDILNPYENVDWAKAKPYRVQFHTHTTASDGRQTLAEAIENYYQHGYDSVVRPWHKYYDYARTSIPYLAAES